MSTTETQYFALLRAALWNTPVTIDDPIDWDAVMALASHHATNVLVSGVATRMTGENKPSPKLLADMQMTMRVNLVNQLQLKQILVAAVSLLRQNDIEPVLLKGFGLAMLYPNPNLRQFGDLDIYIGLDKFHEACAVLRTMPGSYNWGEITDAGHHYNIEFGSLPMEVHRVSAEVAADDETIYTAIEHDGLGLHPQRVDFEGNSLSIPSKEFAVFYTFFHAWNHFLTSGVGWRQLSDVTMTLHAYHDQLDLDKLHQWLSDMRLMLPWQTFGCLLVDHLGLPEAELPFSNPSCRPRSKKLYRLIMQEGNFKRDRSFKRRRPKNRLGQKLHALFGIFVDGFHTAKVFPKEAFHGIRNALKFGLKKNFSKK